MRRNLFISLLGLLLSLFLYSNFTIAGNTPASSPPPSKTQSVIHVISPSAAWKLIQNNRNNPDFIILDVRTPKEYFSGRIPGAINHNFYEVTFRQTLSRLDSDKIYFVYCRSGIRSKLASELMKKMGFKKIFDLKGGILNWKKSNFPIVSGP